MLKRPRSWILALLLIVGSGLVYLGMRAPVVPESRASSQLTAASDAEPMRHLFSRPAPNRTSGLSGRVSADGAPVAGAWVCASCANCEPTRAEAASCAYTTTDGQFALTSLNAGGYLVSATASGFASASAQRGRPVVVAEGELLRGVDIALSHDGARIHGSVLDATGGSVAGAHVRALRLQPSPVVLDTYSDSQGEFELWLSPGFVELSADADGYARASLRATAPGGVELRLLPGASIEGRVVLAGTREPMANVQVKATRPDNPQLALAQGGVSDLLGKFRVDGLEPGSYALTAVADRARNALPFTVELGIADSVRDVELVLVPAAEVTGRVHVEEDGSPCRQGLVSLGDPDPTEPAPTPEELRAVGLSSAPTRASGPEQVADIQVDGSVRFPGVPPGVYFASVRCADHAWRAGPRVVRVADQSLSGLTWSVARGGRLVVSVVDARDKPVADAQFMLELPAASARTMTAHETDVHGRSVIEGLVAGQYRLFGADQNPSETVSVTLLEGAQETEATLRLSGGATILALVTDEQGRPIDGLTVSGSAVVEAPSTERPAFVQHALPLGEGRYRIGPVAVGRYLLSVDDGVNPPPESTPASGLLVHVSREADVSTRVTLRRGATLRGLVVDDRGTPAPDVWVTVKPNLTLGARGARRTLAVAQSRTKRVLSDERGQFVLEGLDPEARFDVRAIEPYGSAVLHKAVAPSDEVRLVLPLTAAVSGTARDQAGRPVQQFLVRASNLDANSQQLHTVVAPDGRFSVPRIAPGAVQLASYAAGGQTATTQLQLAAGERRSGVELSFSGRAAATDDDP